METDLQQHPLAQRLISRRELAWFLGVNVRWVDHRVRTDPDFPSMPPVGRYPRFWLRDVLDYLKEPSANSHCNDIASASMPGHPNAGGHVKVGAMRRG